MAVNLYTDGSSLGNPGPGGWAFLLVCQDSEPYLFSGSEQKSTNNIMELTACIKGLLYTTAIYPETSINVYTDSRYVQKGSSEWIKNWSKNNWKNSKGECIKNKELWQQMYSILVNFSVKFFWVEAHTKNTDEHSKYNAIVDEKARLEASTQSSPPMNKKTCETSFQEFKDRLRQLLNEYE